MRKALYSIWATLVLSVSPPTLCDDSATVAAVTTCPASVPELKPTPQPACSLSSEPVDLAPEFLSFEEWKEKMAQRAEVAKDLAAAEHDTTNEGQKEHETTNALNDPAHDQSPSPDIAALAVPSTPLPRSHIPLIDRFNYASSECNARIQAADKSGKSAVSILTRTKDKYMLSPCQTSEQKFVVVELCEDIRIDTVQLANFEFFSGVFKDIRVSVAHAYTDDGQGWVLLGEYKAKNIRGVQTFHPTRHLPHFYRYLRVDFLSYYGSEYYCPVSLLRVYGLTPMEEWKYDVWVAEWEAMYGGSSNIAATPTISSGVMETVARSPETIKVVETDARIKVSSAHETMPETAVDHSTGAFTVNMDDSHTPTPSSSMEDTSPEQTAQATHTDPSSQDQHTKGSCQHPAVQTDYPIGFILIDNPNGNISDSTHSSDDNHQSNGTKAHATKVIVTTTTSVAVVPTALGGESVYRMILNRLSNLEGNQTLYARYVEDQARSANDRLRILEEEVGRLGALAKTQQQTLIKLLERHRLDQEMEITRISSRIDSLAHEVVLEKRIGIAQLVLLSTVLIFMALTRGSRGNPVVESARFVNSLRREAGSGFYRGLRTSNEWVSSFRTGGIRAYSGPDEATAAAVRNSRARVAGSSLLGRRSRSRRGSSGLRSGEETGAGAGGLSSGVGGDLEINTSKPTPGSASVRQQQISKAPMKNLGLFGSRSVSTSGRALDQLHVPGSAKRLARTVHLHEVKPAGRDEKARREAKAKLKDREVVKNLTRDSGGVGKVPFPSSYGQNTPGEPDTDSAWVDDTDVEGSISSPQIEKHYHDAWLRQSNGFLLPFELAPPPKPQHRRTTKSAENLKLDIKESPFGPVLQETNLI